VFRRRRFFQGHSVRGMGPADEIAWFRPDGDPMGDDDWTNGFALAVAVYLNGGALPDVDTRGERVTDDSFLLLMNGHGEAVDFVLPSRRFAKSWVVDLDTDAAGAPPEEQLRPGAKRTLPGHSLVLLRREA
jgi:glycogen operon protein